MNDEYISIHNKAIFKRFYSSEGTRVSSPDVRFSSEGEESSLSNKISDIILNHVDIVTEHSTQKKFLYDYLDNSWKEGELFLERIIYEKTFQLCTTSPWTQFKEVTNHITNKAKVISKFSDDYLVFKNQTLDRKTMVMKENSPTYYAHYNSDVTFKPGEKPEKFAVFLNEIFEADQERIDFVQEYFGYTLMNSHKANAFLIAYGTGANGKSILFSLLQELVGKENTSAANISTFDKKFGLEVLLDSILNLSTESDVPMFSSANLKAISAGESVVVNRKGLKEITTVIPSKQVFLVNNLPNVLDRTHGLSRRLYVLPFNRTFSKEEQNPELFEQLMLELSGILNWCIEGAQRLIRNNYQFTSSHEMDVVKSKMLNSVSPLEFFIKEKVELNTMSKVLVSSLFDQYSLFLSEHSLSNGGIINTRSFIREIRAYFDKQGIVITTIKSNGQNYLSGIRQLDNINNDNSSINKIISGTFGTSRTTKWEDKLNDH